HSPFKASYPSRHRSVYLMTQRIQRHPYLSLFDGPDTNMSTDVRTTATVPSQALLLMNNPSVNEQAVALAERLLQAAENDRDRVELAGRLCWSRQISPAEVDRAMAFLNAVRQDAGQRAAANVDRTAWSSFARVILASNEFFYLD